MSTYEISTEQVERTGNIAAIAVVQRLDRIVELLDAIHTQQTTALQSAYAVLAEHGQPAPGAPVDTEEGQ